tara:strand:+ start:743 stop:1432 length:690 start_codon:yes stop_codon:yes gene_type:complete
MEKIGVIIQARMGSTRLPGKIMLNLKGKTILQQMVERFKKTNADEVIVATSTKEKDNIIEDFCKEKGYKYFRGSEEDVLARFFHCAQEFSLNHIIRSTADDPFVDHEIINEMIKIYSEGNWDCVTNEFPLTFPYGLNCCIFSSSVLKNMFENAKGEEREHVVTHIYHNKDKFKIFNFKSQEDYSKIKLTVDTLEEYYKAHKIYSKLYSEDKLFLLKDLINYFKEEENEN